MFSSWNSQLSSGRSLSGEKVHLNLFLSREEKVLLNLSSLEKVLLNLFLSLEKVLLNLFISREEQVLLNLFLSREVLLNLFLSLEQAFPPVHGVPPSPPSQAFPRSQVFNIGMRALGRRR
ncbi:unnamed protein product, partial [Gadus morhua 'NCC']